MIVDRIENINLYNAISPSITKALHVLSLKDICIKPVGRHEIDGNKLYYLVQNYTTKPRDTGLLESHKKYLDIQFIVEGEESIFFEHISELQETVAYDEKDDVVLYKQPASVSDVHMSPGMFCILFPEDAHGPCRTAVRESKVHKIVFKVAI